MSANPRIWPVVVTAVLGIAVLIGLGAWQLERLQWKQALLAEVAARGEAAPVDLAEAARRWAAGENIEFLKVSARGQFRHADEKLLIGVYDGSPGWEVVTPLLTADGMLVLVDRGVVPDDLRTAARRAPGNPAGDVAVTGIIRARAAARGFFSPDNDAKANMWFWWDVPAMLATLPPSPGVKPQAFVLQLLPVAGERSFPRPLAPETGLSNNHLQYAITWFALAVVLAAVASLYVRGQMKKTGA